MKYLYILIVGLTFISCKKEDTDPGNNNGTLPTPLVDLSCHFEATINGTYVELTENVQGYTGSAFKTSLANPSPNFSENIYHFGMNSLSSNLGVAVAHGSVYWDNGVSIEPSLGAFNLFHTNDTLPSYTNMGLGGFEFIYIDNAGTTWQSSSFSTNFQTVEFNNVTLGSDDTGDYAVYTCNFTCYVYNIGQTDSLLVENAAFQGWFKR